ncbi:hypothetical protein [Frigidibacter mobilis]|uniref:PD(D/E)XK endonuclease domain-containing protein n=1 Tax=Frigidibacter mobilis TaxID=1335048 RepID=A0A159Z4U5_9RHOB|nr:hypothetical protein [Frigidibacter mobilis]AMY69358.1 hypothetical protein AKL17_2112 [Frigidibacter mobilis]
MSRHWLMSSQREQSLEYVLLGALCQEMWKRGSPLDILRSHTDQSGYDLVLDTGSTLRFVQLKSSYLGATTASQGVNVALAGKPGGCIIWLRFAEADLSLDHFLFFGAAEPGGPLPDLGERAVRHTKGNAEGIKAIRPGLRSLPRNRFERVDNIQALADRLFGRHQTTNEGSSCQH